VRVVERNSLKSAKSDVKIRIFKEVDIPQIVELFNKVFGKQGALLRTPDVFRWRYLECPDFDEKGIIVAELNNEIVSSAVITFKKIKIEEREYFIGAIDDVMTHPKARKKGFAKTILQKLIEYGKLKNVDGLMLYTGVESIAYNFYKKLGFEDINHYTSLVKVTNPKKILKVGDFKTKLFSLWIIATNYLKRIPKISSDDSFELLKLTSDSNLREALNLYNMYNNQFVGYKEIDWERWLWMNKKLDIAQTQIFGVKNKRLGSLDAIAVITKHEGTFFKHTLNYGILKLAYNARDALFFLLSSLDKISQTLDIDFFLFSLPVLENELDIKKILQAYKFIDFGKLAGTYACLMMLFFNNDLKKAVNVNKIKPWYIFLEHKLGRP